MVGCEERSDGEGMGLGWDWLNWLRLAQGWLGWVVWELKKYRTFHSVVISTEMFGA